MAQTFKDLTQSDVVITRTLLHESIPVTGTIVSGTYAEASNGRELNIKSFEHGMFQSVYDYPHASSSANHIFDLSCGFSTTGNSVSSSATVQTQAKVNIYNQMAQILVGYDTGSNIRRFDADGALADGTKHDNVLFFNFARLLTKDEIKKGSFSMTLGNGVTYATPFSTERIVTDAASVTNYKINSPAGEYGILKTTEVKASATLNFTNAPAEGNQVTIIALNSDGSTTTSAPFTVTGNSGTTDANEFARGGDNNGAANFVTAIGLSPIAALVTVTRDGNTVTIEQKTAGSAGNTAITCTPTLANVSINGGTNGNSGQFTGGHTSTDIGLLYYQAGIAAVTASVFDETANMDASNTKMEGMFKSKTIDEVSDSVRHRIKDISFNNTTELNSTIYFCRANHNEFNYSSNPTYLNEHSKIRVKDTGLGGADNPPISYITTVGLYSADNELLAVAKLSEPLKKMSGNDLTLRVRLDY